MTNKNGLLEKKFVKNVAEKLYQYMSLKVPYNRLERNKTPYYIHVYGEFHGLFKIIV